MNQENNIQDIKDRLLQIASSEGASDIYTVVNYYPSIKIHGQIYALTDGFDILTKEDVNRFVDSLMDETQKNTYDTEKELDFSYSYGKARFRVNVFHQMKNPSCCLRYLRSDIPTIDSLGLPDICKTLSERHSGIILLAGPTGSGKSTTLCAMVNHINSNYTKHIITIEDPVEYIHPLKKSIVEQREVGTDCKTFAKAMKSALRQNPNVLILGEMRDLESISSAITIAETGHLVFSTIHARSSVQTINKMIDSFPADQQNQIRQQISETLLAVISQRLIPNKDGSGQELALEIMIVNTAISNMIREKQTHQIESIIQTNKNMGMQLLDNDLIRLVSENKIDINTAMKYTNNQASVRSKLVSMGLSD